MSILSLPLLARLQPVSISALESALEATADPAEGASGGAGSGDSQSGLVAASSLRRLILCRTIDRLNGKDVSVVAISAYDERTLATKVAAFLEKPFTSSQLLATLQPVIPLKC
jgi:hypothetical protein